MEYKNSIENIDRRTFLSILSFTGLGGLIYPQQLFSGILGEALSRVVIVEDSSATSGVTIASSSTVQVMVDEGIKSLAQIQSVGDAWKSLFSGIDSSKIIAIKVNCINGNMPTHPEVTYAVTNGLKQMEINGSPFGLRFNKWYPYLL